MEGCVKNVGPSWIYIFKQGIPQGATISLDELYGVYGEKNNLDEGQDFIDWLNNVKLKGKSSLVIELPSTKHKVKTVTKKEQAAADKAAEDAYEELSDIDKIVMMTVVKAKDKIPHITDKKQLKYALQVAKQKPNKDTLCILLEKRIREIEQVS